MNIKLDENLGNLRVATWLRFAGHGVTTVREQGLTSASDEELIHICTNEGRVLVTSDRGFENRIKYNPSRYMGIIVIRLSARSKFEEWREAIDTLIAGLDAADVTGKLWIIRQGNIQEYQPLESDKPEG